MSQPHFIVFANEKGGTGKSTTAVHTAVALAAMGHKVAALDLDSRQRTMTRYFENRDATMRRLNTRLPHARYAVLEGQTVEGLDLALRELCEGVDVIVIDTPGRDDPLARAAILKADTLVTPTRRRLWLSMCCSRFRRTTQSTLLPVFFARCVRLFQISSA